MREAAEALGLGPCQVLALIDGGQLVGRDIDGQTFVPRDSIAEFVADWTGVGA